MHIKEVQTPLPHEYIFHEIICEWFLEKCIDPNFVFRVLFTDEAQFTKTALVNVHNQHVWVNDNLSDRIFHINAQKIFGLAFYEKINLCAFFFLGH